MSIDNSFQFFVERVSKRLGKTITQIPAGIIQQLQDYSWPGNVREQENVIERAVINSSEPKLHLAGDLSGPAEKEMPTQPKSLQEIEKDHIIRVLEETSWRIDGPKGAAGILDTNPSTVINLGLGVIHVGAACSRDNSYKATFFRG